MWERERGGGEGGEGYIHPTLMTMRAHRARSSYCAMCACIADFGRINSSRVRGLWSDKVL